MYQINPQNNDIFTIANIKQNIKKLLKAIHSIFNMRNQFRLPNAKCWEAPVLKVLD